MLWWWIASGSILFGTTNGQKEQTEDICNFDPDVIFFNDETLEKLRKSFAFGGECSPAILKSKLNYLVDAFKTRSDRDVGEYSSRDQELTELKRQESDSHKEDFQNIPNRNLFSDYETRLKTTPPVFTTPGQRTTNYFFPNNQQRQQLDTIYTQNEEHFQGPAQFFGRPNRRRGHRQFDKHNARDYKHPSPPDKLFETPSEVGFWPKDDRRRQEMRKEGVFLPPQMIISPDKEETGTTRPNHPDYGSTPRPEPVLQTTTLPGPPTWATSPTPCVRRCPSTPEYNPVCGSDRVTYNNPGRLRCQQQCGNASVELRHYGVCREGVVDSALLNRSLYSVTADQLIHRYVSPRPTRKCHL